jgi:hypothetical protein
MREAVAPHQRPQLAADNELREAGAMPRGHEKTRAVTSAVTGLLHPAHGRQGSRNDYLPAVSVLWRSRYQFVIHAPDSQAVTFSSRR